MNNKNEIMVSSVKIRHDGILHIEISDNQTFAVQLYVNRKGDIGVNNTKFDYLGWEVVKIVHRRDPYAEYLEEAQQRIEVVRKSLNKLYESLDVLKFFYKAGKEDAYYELPNFEHRLIEYFKSQNPPVK